MLLEKAEHIPPMKTDTIGIDDWVYRKRQNYGTIIVGGHTHKVIDLHHGNISDCRSSSNLYFSFQENV